MNRQSYKITAIYTRIDRGSAPDISSVAITIQQKTLARYTKEHGLYNLQIFDYEKCEHLVMEILPKHNIELYAVRERISPQTPLVFFFPALSSLVGGEQ